MVYASPLTLLGKTGCKNYFVICNYTPIFRFTVSVASSKVFPSYSWIASALQSLCVDYWVSRQVGKVPISSVLDGGVITYCTYGSVNPRSQAPHRPSKPQWWDESVFCDTFKLLPKVVPNNETVRKWPAGET